MGAMAKILNFKSSYPIFLLTRDSLHFGNEESIGIVQNSAIRSKKSRNLHRFPAFFWRGSHGPTKVSNYCILPSWINSGAHFFRPI